MFNVWKKKNPDTLIQILGFCQLYRRHNKSWKP